MIAVDTVPEKLDGAREFGATDVVLATGDDADLQIRRLTGGRGADTVLVTVGAAEAYRNAPRFLAPRGQLIAVGMPPSDAWAEWSPGDFSYLGQGIRGSCLGDTVLSRDIPFLVELYRQGRLKLDELVTGRYPLERINDAIDDTRAGRSRRNVILFDRNRPMKLADLDILVVGNPPPGWGGRYFFFVKVSTACGIAGYGEVYAAAVGPAAMEAVVRDVFERHMAGENPENTELMFRRAYSSGFTQRPDPTVMGAFSGLEMACWDILGKAHGRPDPRLPRRDDERTAPLLHLSLSAARP